MNLLIKFFRPENIRLGSNTLSGKYYEETIKFFPEIASKDFDIPTRAIGVCASKVDGGKPAYLLKITDFKQVAKGIKIFYTISDILNITSDEVIRMAFRRLTGDGKIKSSDGLPLWCVLDDIQMEAVINPKGNRSNRANLTLKDQMQFLKDQEQWFKMYDPFRPVSKLSENNPKVWKDPEIISHIAYAASRLSQIEDIPPEAKYDFFKRNDFLNGKRLLRMDVEVLMKRCMELDPKNPIYCSDLAKFHYRNVMELTAKKGRNDGNPLSELDQAVKHYDKALELDINRMYDLFDKGYLLTVKYPEIISGLRNRITSYHDKASKIKEGIDAFKRLIDLWLGYKDYVLKQRELKVMYTKEYIQTLFCLGLAYDELVLRDWDVIGLYMGLYSNEKQDFEDDDMENAENALKYFVACWNAECDTGCLPNLELSECVSSEWVVNGIDKLFYLGNINLKLYRIYAAAGLQDESKRSLKDAELFLTEALDTDPPTSDLLKPKEHIADRLAKVYITMGKYDNALQIIQKHCNKRRLKGMITNTYALALLLSKRHQEAERLLERASCDITNPYAMPATFLLGMTYLEQGLIEAASDLFKKAVRHKYKDYPMARDVFYIGLAEIEAKSGNKRNAVMYCKKAVETEPYRSFAGNRLKEIRESL